MRRRGFTLPEVLTVALLMGIVLFLLGALFYPTAKLFRTQDAASETQQGVLLFVQRVEEGLLNTQLETVTVGLNVPCISWQQPNPENPYSAADGTPIMAPRFTILTYDAPTGRVLTREYDVAASTDPKKPQRLAVDVLETQAGVRDGKERVLCRNVSGLEITDQDGDPVLLDPPLRLTVECAIDTSMQGAITEERFTMTTRVSPRSSRW